MNNHSAHPLVSCIIPLYNKAPYICRAIDSILNQTVENFEIIVVNDGSTDGGEKNVEKYSDSRIKLINQENKGVSVARNNGVLNAKAELVAFLDADDEWLPEFLETVLNLRKKWPNAGLYATKYSSINQDNLQTKKTRDIEFNNDGLIENYFHYLNKYNFIIISSSALLIPKEIFTKYGGYNPSIEHGEDRDLYCRIALKYMFAYSPKMMNNCYYNCCNNSFKRIRNCNTSFLKCVGNKGNCIVNHPFYPDIRKYADSYFINVIFYNIFQMSPASLSKPILDMIQDKYLLKWILRILLISLSPKRIHDITIFIKKRRNIFRICKRLLTLI